MKPILHPRQAVELFHCRVLKALDERVPKESYAIKGGCNLRMLLGSPRSSEDLDIDIQQVAKHTLEKIMETIIGKQVSPFLRTHNVKISDFRAVKQTDTVQRWKFAIEFLQEEFPTKIEFSRRKLGEAKRGQIVPEFQAAYETGPLALSHYGPTPALHQKISALAKRAVTQARDVFDIAFLQDLNPKFPAGLGTDILQKARDNASSLRFPDFSGQVIPYLDDQTREELGNEPAWLAMRQKVLGLLKTPAGRDNPGIGHP